MKNKPIIAMGAPVSIQAAENDEDKGPRTFSSTFYTGGALNINGYDLPVVVDLAGLKNGRVLVANLDHDSTKRVGNFEVVNDGKQLVANGKATAATAARDEVVNSAANGYQWQASLEVQPTKIETVAKGKSVTVNGQEIVGPAYVTRSGTLKGFAFVSHGADDNTTATIAASAASSTKEFDMDPKFKAWIEVMGFDASELSETQLAGLQANYDGKNGAKPKKPIKGENPFEDRKIEAKRRQEIRDVADKLIEQRGSDFDEITAIEKMVDHAIEAGMETRDFRLELYESTIPMGHTVRFSSNRSPKTTNRVLEAAICQAGRLPNLDAKFTDQELQAAHDQFREGISLNQFLIHAAECNGYRGMSATKVNLDVQRAAFGMTGNGRPIHGTGFSTIDVSSIVSNVANKFLHEGWMSVDMTCMRIAAIRPVNDLKQTTTVSLTGALQFEELGPAGQIKHGTLGEVTYNNQAKTYAAMLAITRTDMINDDLGALTAVPRRLGRGGALKLNDIFWTEFLILETDGFFAAGNNNLLDGVATLTIEGLTRAEALFLNQTDYDGKPLGIEPAIVLAPTALKAQGAALLDAQSKFVTGASATVSDTNVFAGRFRLESSPYMSNSSYTGYSAAEWYLLADPNVLPVIEIAALNGRVEPQVDTADADFNTLGVQMRGYSDVGVTRQEKKAGVLADGGSS